MNPQLVPDGYVERHYRIHPSSLNEGPHAGIFRDDYGHPTIEITVDDDDENLSSLKLDPTPDGNGVILVIGSLVIRDGGHSIDTEEVKIKMWPLPVEVLEDDR